MNLKEIGKVFTSKFVGTGPSSYEKRIYRAAVSQISRNTAVGHGQPCCGSFLAKHETVRWVSYTIQISAGPRPSAVRHFVTCTKIEHGDINLRHRGVQNLGRHVTVTTILFLRVVPNIREFSVWKLLHAGVLGPRNSKFASTYLEKCLHTSVRRPPLRVTPLPLHYSPSSCHPTLHCHRRRRRRYANEQTNRRQQ